MNYWNEKFQYSLGQQQVFDIKLLKREIPNCIRIIKTNTKIDKTGIDYIAYLEGGAKIYIDAKTRMPGCSRYWKNGPELALEIWSVKEKKIPGWTLSTKSQVDYILFTFPEKECEFYFLFPYQQLRKAFIINMDSWSEEYCRKEQKNQGYHSEAIFVPAKVVMKAVRNTMYGISKSA